MSDDKSVLKILICDDDPQDRKLVRAFLRKTKAREMVIIEAGGEAEIQQALNRGRVDLVLMDVQMPGRSGMQWLKEIVDRQLAPVVMLTGHGNEDVAVESLKQGAIGYLSKNRLSSDRLEVEIEQTTEKWQAFLRSKADQEQLERLANIDPLTGLLNRRAILHKLDEYIAASRRYDEKLGIIMLDIDHFKMVNDKYGHMVGDDVLERLSATIRGKVRDTDYLGRYGGEEFLMVLPRTDFSAALMVGERIRVTTAKTKMKDAQEGSFYITVSQGITSHRTGDDRNSMISRADDALYRAKANGRNRVEALELTGSVISDKDFRKFMIAKSARGDQDGL